MGCRTMPVVIVVWQQPYCISTRQRQRNLYDFLTPVKEIYGISYSWRSILRGVSLLKEGLIWQIGNGENVKIWVDPWLPKGTTRRPITPKGASLLSRVNELINPITGEWDVQLPQEMFWPEDANEIVKIPIDDQLDDWPAWPYDKKGMFSVKSAYKVAVAIRDKNNGVDASSSGGIVSRDGEFGWHKIWQLKVPNKVKMFMWRLAHNSLPVRRNVARRGVDLDVRCPVCMRLDEDCGHLFFKCKFVKQCWRLLDIETVREEMLGCQSGKEVCNKHWSLNQKLQLNIIVFLWRWWSVLNKINEGEGRQNAEDFQNSVFYFMDEIAKLDKSDTKNQRPRTSWTPPPNDLYKINFDGSFLPSAGSGVWGFVARKRDGEVLAVGAGKIDHAASALQTEAVAGYKSIHRVASLGMTRIILETDASVLADAISSKEIDRSPIGCLVSQIREFMRSEFVYCIV